ncbi:SWIM zinc finger [Halorubrum aquaticum]|uniref:SWIM zinc finger n=1 Tax=Halorubrum aquaticum TaxID=387340 RepID=A0A1I2ZSQ6_9EURY|nr:SWIM zinc finger family protein [Halorubrum aquaticum]SFH40559.1 SWIM zinc finger [Halorubrum aquaticum]
MTHRPIPPASFAVDNSAGNGGSGGHSVDGNGGRDDDSGRDRDVDRAGDVDRDPDSNREDGRSERAKREPMTVRPLRDRRYVVETDGGTYVVALDSGSCSCPDHEIRGSRCKHLRRVAIEVTEGRLPAPDERIGVCAVCGVETFVPFAASGPRLCERHGFDRGDAVRDRETGKLLVVTHVTERRADEYRTDEGRPIDQYPTNAAYGAHEPVVEAVYAESLGPAHGIDDARRYGFPASRLVPVDVDREE